MIEEEGAIGQFIELLYVLALAFYGDKLDSFELRSVYTVGWGNFDELPNARASTNI